MIRRMLVTLIGALALTLVLAVPASAQSEDDAVVSPTPSVLPDVITRTPTAPPAPEVKSGSALPNTGAELGGVAIIGLGLTGIGVALAVGARRRRSELGTA